ncbi:MAG: hypothetical protein CME36_09780 [unclassified Hahellaceae]|nr:hypothetical protein [Hahellaceae bacterium]|tara:strand:- start:21330 stop:21824 length:495 start_codon:yes stop_codon:yes gene_type:complete
MAVSITTEIQRDFRIEAPLGKVFDILADVPSSATYFPKLEQLSDLGNNSYRWALKRIGVDKHSLQTVYACRYISDRSAGTVRWEPLEEPATGDDNSLVKGQWTLEEERDGAGNEGTRCRFSNTGTITLPLPGIMKLAASPLVKHEFNTLIDDYIENLQQGIPSS